MHIRNKLYHRRISRVNKFTRIVCHFSIDIYFSFRRFFFRATCGAEVDIQCQERFRHKYKERRCETDSADKIVKK